jgi:hypothetical protein
MDRALQEQFSKLIGRLRSSPEFSNPARTEIIQRICSELEGIRSSLEKNGEAPPQLVNKVLAVMLEMGEVAFAPQPLPKDLLEWAREQYSEEEIIAGIEEIRATGGLELRDFLGELQEAANRHE